MRYKDDRTQMTVDIQAKGFTLPDDERERMQRALGEVGAAVRELPPSTLRVDLIFHPQSKVYHARFELHVPGRSLFTDARDAYLDSAFQNGARNLLRELSIYRENPDHDAVDEARDRAELGRAILAPEDPRVGQIAEAALNGDYHTFRTGLAAYEDWLRLRVGRWVQRYPKADARIGSDLLIGDLVEAVYLLAFERFANRPTVVSLHEWLQDLIDPAVKNVLRRTDQEHQAASLARTVRAAPLA